MIEATNPEKRKELIDEELERRQQRLIQYFRRQKQKLDAKGVFDSRTNQVRIQTRLRNALANINMNEIENVVDEQLLGPTVDNQKSPKIFSTEVDAKKNDYSSSSTLSHRNRPQAPTSMSLPVDQNQRNQRFQKQKDQKSQLETFRSKSQLQHRKSSNRHKSGPKSHASRIKDSNSISPTGRSSSRKSTRQRRNTPSQSAQEVNDDSNSNDPHDKNTEETPVPIADIGTVSDQIPGLHYTLAESMEREMESSQGYHSKRNRKNNPLEFLERKRQGNITRLSDNNWRPSYLLENFRKPPEPISKDQEIKPSSSSSSSESEPEPKSEISYWINSMKSKESDESHQEDQFPKATFYQEADSNFISISQSDLGLNSMKHVQALKQSSDTKFWLRKLVNNYFQDKNSKMIDTIQSDLRNQYTHAYSELPKVSNENPEKDEELAQPISLLEKSIVYLCQQFIRRKKLRDTKREIGSVRIILVNMLLSMNQYKSTIRTRRSWTKGAELLLTWDLELNEVFDPANVNHLLDLAGHYVGLNLEVSGFDFDTESEDFSSSTVSVPEGMQSVGTGVSALELWRKIVNDKLIPKIRELRNTNIQPSSTELFTRWVEDHGLFSEQENISSKIIEIIDKYIRMSFHQTIEAFQYFVTKSKRFYFSIVNSSRENEQYEKETKSEPSYISASSIKAKHIKAGNVNSYIDLSSPHPSSYFLNSSDKDSDSTSINIDPPKFDLDRWRREIRLIDSVPKNSWKGILNEYKKVANIDLELFDLVESQKYDDFKRRLLAHLRLQRDEFLKNMFFEIAERYRDQFWEKQKDMVGSIYQIEETQETFSTETEDETNEEKDNGDKELEVNKPELNKNKERETQEKSNQLKPKSNVKPNYEIKTKFGKIPTQQEFSPGNQSYTSFTLDIDNENDSPTVSPIDDKSSTTFETSLEESSVESEEEENQETEKTDMKDKIDDHESRKKEKEIDDKFETVNKTEDNDQSDEFRTDPSIAKDKIETVLDNSSNQGKQSDLSKTPRRMKQSHSNKKKTKKYKPPSLKSKEDQQLSASSTPSRNNTSENTSFKGSRPNSPKKITISTTIRYKDDNISPSNQSKSSRPRTRSKQNLVEKPKSSGSTNTVLSKAPDTNSEFDMFIDREFGMVTKNVTVSQNALNFGEEKLREKKGALSGNFAKIRARNKQIKESLQTPRLTEDVSMEQVQINASKLDFQKTRETFPVGNPPQKSPGSPWYSQRGIKSSQSIEKKEPSSPRDNIGSETNSIESQDSKSIHRSEQEQVRQRQTPTPPQIHSSSRLSNRSENPASSSSSSPSKPLTPGPIIDIESLQSQLIPNSKEEKRLKDKACSMSSYKLLLSMSNIWDKLEIDPTLKSFMYRKYKQGPFSHNNVVEKAFVLWNLIFDKIDQREKLLSALRDFEIQASDPRRLLKGTSKTRIEEEKRRNQYMKPLYKLTREIYFSIQRLRKELDDEVYLKDTLYIEKMQTDYSTILYQLEDDRLISPPDQIQDTNRIENSIPVNDIESQNLNNLKK
eukprot:gb/GECH01015039.1/.p1 GENE.gb/GECH01015039.1/~~gb/GECH01015039.1/.p1  ORF type:complete len:1521 (+),score=413.36 gb/GECH01015039.1/:1-4563(+)